MPLDPSIILGAGQGVTPIQNPVDIMSKAMDYKKLSMQTQQAAQDFQDNQAMRSAMGNNTKVDENGTPHIDRQGVLKELGQTSPSTVMKAAQGFAQNDMAIKQQQMENQSKQFQFIGQLAGGVTDQASWNKALSTAKASGIDTSGMPDQYDPNVVQHIQGQALTADQQVKNQIAMLGEQNKAQQLKIDSYKAFGAGGMPGGVSGGTPNPPGYVPPQKPGQAPKLSEIDPSNLINRAPPDKQEAVAKEIKHAQNIADIGPQLLDSQNKIITALKNNDFRGMKAEQNRYSALMAPAFKDVEESAGKQAAIDHMVETTMPGIQDKITGGSPQRQQALSAFIQSGQSAPISKQYGIDLSKFKSTRIDPGMLSNTEVKTPEIQQAKSNSIHPALQGMNKQQLLDLKSKMEQSNAK